MTTNDFHDIVPIGHGFRYKRQCVQLTSKTNFFSQDYDDEAFADGVPVQHFTCRSAQTTTFTWHLDAAVKFEAGLIFEKVETTVSGGISRSTSTTVETSAYLDIPANRWGHCRRGVFRVRFTGRSKEMVKKSLSGRAVRWGDVTGFRGNAPRHHAWLFGLGRL